MTAERNPPFNPAFTMLPDTGKMLPSASGGARILPKRLPRMRDTLPKGRRHD